MIIHASRPAVPIVETTRATLRCQLDKRQSLSNIKNSLDFSEGSAAG
jgi:hypothetical protein